MTEKELLVTKKIEQVCKGWGFHNFKIERFEDCIFFKMEIEDTEFSNAKRIVQFTSQNQRLFSYCGYKLISLDDGKPILGIYNFPLTGLFLHIFGSICDILDGLLENYYIK